jgi:hypothetical protein
VAPLPPWIPGKAAAFCGSTSARAERNGHLKDAPIDLQEHFRALMATLGITPGRGNEETFLCPWHNDRRHPNLSVNWRAGVFICFACQTKGGLRELRRLLGKDPGPGGGSGLRHETPRISATVAEVAAINREAERTRLVTAMKELGGEFIEVGPRDGWEPFKAVELCGKTYDGYEADDGCRKRMARYCHQTPCSNCVPVRLRKDFKKHGAQLPERMDAYVWEPPPGKTTRKEIGAAFNHWRRKNGIAAGIYGVRLRVGAPDVLLLLPAGAPCPLSPIRDSLDREAAVTWYSDRAVEEVTSWRDANELMELIWAIKGRRRFQGFGAFFERQKEEEVTVIAKEPKKLGRVAGGSGQGQRERVTCDHDLPMRRVREAMSDQESKAWVERSQTLCNNPQWRKAG